MIVSWLDRIRFSPFLVQIVPTRRCNLRCGYCNEYDHTSPPVPEEIMKSRMDRIRSLGTLGLEFSGGEPLLHPDIFRLVAHASRLGFFTRWLITNGYLLDEKAVGRLGDAGLTHMQVSVDGVTPNRVTVKTLKPLRKKLAMLSRRAGFRVVLNTVIGAAPPDEVREVFRFAWDHGFKPRVGLIHDGAGRLNLSAENRQLFWDLRSYLGANSREAGNYRNKLVMGRPAPFKCRAGSRYLYVDEYGKVHRCSQKRKRPSKNLMDYTRADLKKEFFTPKPCTNYCTVSCVRTASKLDEWRRQEIA
jgi:MoaA/NifB/PqqE/SkfB family radical SAM enzyme